MTSSVMAKMCTGTFPLVILLASPTLQAQKSVQPVDQRWGRMISLANDGVFETKWETIEKARAASAGNGYNSTLKLGSEIIVFNSRCNGDVSYSLFAVPTPVIEDTKKLSAGKLQGPEYAAEQRKLVTNFLRYMDKKLPANPSACDAVAVEISFADGRAVRLEQDDVGTALVGSRINDAYVFEATRIGKVRSATVPGSTPLTGGLLNGFTDAKAAMFAASKLAGTEIAVVNGDKIYLYRATGKLMDYSADEAKLAALKAVKPANGLEILGMITGTGANMKVMRTDGR